MIRLPCTIFVLFFIVLYKFYPNEFLEIEQYDLKIQNYNKAAFNYLKDIRPTGSSTAKVSLAQARGTVDPIMIQDYLTTTTFEWIGRSATTTPKESASTSEQLFFQFIHIFLPIIQDQLTLENRDNWLIYLKQFEGSSSEILLNFAKYLIKNKNIFRACKSNYRLWDLFKMVRTIL